MSVGYLCQVTATATATTTVTVSATAALPGTSALHKSADVIEGYTLDLGVDLQYTPMQRIDRGPGQRWVQGSMRFAGYNTGPATFGF